MNRLGFLVGALIVFAAIPILLKRLREAPPPWRVRLSFVSLVGLFSASASLLAGILLPEVLQANSVRDVLSTCMQAFQTIGADPQGRWPSIMSGAALALIFGRFVWSMILGAQATRRARIVQGTPRWTLGGRYPVYVVALGRAESYVMGCWRSQVLLSQELLDILENDERQGVLLHEEAHLKGRHHVLLMIARAIQRALAPLPSAGRILGLLEQAIEEAADEYAANRLGDRTVVASGVAKAALAGLGSPRLAPSIRGGPDVPARVRRMLLPVDPPGWTKFACLPLAGGLLALLGMTQAFAGLALIAAAHHILGVGMAMSCPLYRRS